MWSAVTVTDWSSSVVSLAVNARVQQYFISATVGQADATMIHVFHSCAFLTELEGRASIQHVTVDNCVNYSLENLKKSGN